VEFLYEYGLFLLKAITIVVAIGIVIGLIVSSSMRMKSPESKGSIEVYKVNERFDDMRDTIKSVILDEETVKKEQKEKLKREKKDKKRLQKLSKKEKGNSDNTVNDENKEPRIYLINFNGDIKASAVEQLRESISAILFTATPNDEVVVRLESAGGLVHSYGLASSQLDRIRKKNIPLTVCVDKVAASGGYMMACVANKICAAPFAIIGSIGVVAQLPNFHKLLKKNDIDFELLTAGEYKRTLTMFGENTDKARDKFVEDLELTHSLFKEHVSQQRPIVDIDQVSTGEIWFGIQAKEKSLIDELTTSDDYITGLAENHDIFEVKYVVKKGLSEKLGLAIQTGVERGVSRLLEQLQASRFFH
jgi:serine protease SohB